MRQPFTKRADGPAQALENTVNWLSNRTGLDLLFFGWWRNLDIVSAIA